MTMPEDGPRVYGPVTDQMVWATIYQFALDVAEQHGSQVTAAAREVGPYGFEQAVRSHVWLSWNGRTDASA
ncbi:hypothetical protein [Streptomyces sp. NPDC087300]|uniref:hypothetical protein n=1 Tax=Streptomyces sp. NPDC087300 TaxID=3365780 RepID=UPI00381075C7